MQSHHMSETAVPKLNASLGKDLVETLKARRTWEPSAVTELSIAFTLQPRYEQGRRDRT